VDKIVLRHGGVIGTLASMSFERVLILGCGYAGSRVLAVARERELPVVASVRSAERVPALEKGGARVLQNAALDEEIQPFIDATTRVVIAFPADASTDQRIAPWLARAHSVVYVSSTGVYGDTRGKVDDSTPLPAAADERVARLQAAERVYLGIGATILRCPAIYGPDRGLHMRVLSGEHRIPGAGTQSLSRIHIADLAQFALSPHTPRAQAFVVGDLTPAPHIDVVRYICEAYKVPMPESAPLDTLHASLRADRAVDPARAIAQLEVELRYPSYRQGMSPEATGIAPRA
jgi:nucleoside-diphosphate-sugar epimerase